MATNRTPNTALASLIGEAGWTNGELARAVNRVGTENGLQLRYDDSAVCHWLSGTMPRTRVRPAVLEAFSRRLHRPVTPREAGFATAPNAPAEAVDMVASVIELGSADMDPTRRAVLGAAGAFSAALALNIPEYAEAADRLDTVKRDPHTRIGYGEVDTVMAMTEKISDLDDQFGGRTARPMAAAFLVNTIAPHLKADAPADVRAAMLSAAADHLYLTGYMAMDERQDGLAQRYYLKALELAQHAHDHLTYCTTLRGMSVMAVDLGHSRLSLRLADSASAASPQAGPRMVAFLAGQQAHAAAQAGDRITALAKIREAEVAMEKAESKAKAFGSYDPSSLAYHVAQVRYELGDKTESIESLEESDRVRYSVYRRGRVRHLGLLAERKLEVGRLEEACGHWHQMLDEYPHVQSGRCDDRYRAMLAAVRPYARNAFARDLYDRARTIKATARA
ncbi:tetratricopeptide repeat protein [Streptomyces sp. NBC_01381]|uniref:tetratricopeptide repeat protein n=1 Tax=Streptomyces sp. NBC_01381 TaxID=2903845 RepID=UPI0022541EF0|nr:tetratricopeptide repeat protein [Streptomyces sp. NBC_01381]MCX4669643.1 tetratricopeptide repeat protein [Streptomyces sp. NBC_01381]